MEIDKTILVETVKTRINEKIKNLEELIRQTQEANSETKSSMGDKYETSREMVAQEIRSLQRQLSEVQHQKDSLSRLSALPNKLPDLGALVQTSNGYFYISTAVGLIDFQNIKIVTVSPEAPLVKAMHGVKIGEKFNVNGSTQTLISIQ